jgi:hypothetical protein
LASDEGKLRSSVPLLPWSEIARYSIFVTHFVGVVLYTRAMFIFFGLLDYWEKNDLPVFRLFSHCPTWFSEESGEIAISVLARSLPSNMKCHYEQTRKAWLLTKQMYSASAHADGDLKRPAPAKSHRYVGNVTYTICLSMFVKTCQKILFNIFYGCFVDDEEPAVVKLSAFFKKMIIAIISGAWQELPRLSAITASLKLQKKKTYFFTKQDCEGLWCVPDTASAMWLGPSRVSARLEDLRLKVFSLICRYLIFCRF